MISESLAFKVLTISGCWLSIGTATKKTQKYLYCLYSTFAIFNYYFIYVLQLIYLFNQIKTKDLHIDTFLLNNAFLFTLFKIRTLVFNRNNFLKMDALLSDPLVAANSDIEIQYHKNCLKRTKFITYLFVFVMETTASCFCALPFTIEKGQLAMKHWVPFEVNKSNYWIIYAWHVYILTSNALAACSSDCIFVDFIEHGCEKLKILRYRLLSMPEILKSEWKKRRNNQDILMREKEILRPLFVQHQLLYKLVSVSLKYYLKNQVS